MRKHTHTNTNFNKCFNKAERGSRCSLTSFTQRGEEDLPDAAAPTVQVPLSGGQLVDSRNKTHDIVVCQHRTALTSTAHTANVTHLHTHSKNKRVTFRLQLQIELGWCE